MMPRTGTIQSSRLLSGALLCALLLLLSSVAAAEVVDAESEEELSPRALRDFYPKGPNLTSEKQLVRFKSNARIKKLTEGNVNYSDFILFNIFCMLL